MFHELCVWMKCTKDTQYLCWIGGKGTDPGILCFIKNLYDVKTIFKKLNQHNLTCLIVNSYHKLISYMIIATKTASKSIILWISTEEKNGKSCDFHSNLLDFIE